MPLALIACAPSPNYENALQLAGFQVIDSCLPEAAQKADCLILPGGADVDPTLYGQQNHSCMDIDSQTDRAQMSLIPLFLQQRKPILGICKGHQLLNVWFGGTLIQHIPQEPSHGWNHGDRVHEVNCMEPCFLSELYGDAFWVNSCHHQAVDRLADPLKPLQYSNDGVLEAFCHLQLPVFGVQWHPERMCGNLRRDDTVDGLTLFRWLYELCTAVDA